jgi:hypothetical protein
MERVSDALATEFAHVGARLEIDVYQLGTPSDRHAATACAERQRLGLVPRVEVLWGDGRTRQQHIAECDRIEERIHIPPRLDRRAGTKGGESGPLREVENNVAPE